MIPSTWRRTLPRRPPLSIRGHALIAPPPIGEPPRLVIAPLAARAHARAEGTAVEMPRPSASFLPAASPERLEELFQQARGCADNVNATVHFERLAAQRFRELVRRPEYDPSKPSIVTSFQPKSGGTFLHNRLLELGYQEYWWCYPHVRCHSFCYANQRTLELYLRGGAACQTHFRPEPALLAEFDRCGVEKIWVHLRNPAESAASAYHHYRGEGHGSGAVGAQRRREALQAASMFRFFQRSSKSRFVRENIAWFIDWTAQWLQYAADSPGRVVFSYHRELADSQRMINRVFREFGVEAPGKITASPIDNDRFRPNPLRDWRQDLDRSTQRLVESRVQEALGRFPALERLWT